MSEDAALNHDGTRGCDIAIINTDKKDDNFSLIEVHRVEAQRQLMFNGVMILSGDSNPSVSTEKVKKQEDK